ncbi:uncharacterized protein LOC127281800 [Leptopilina boulardi]|uniref:uncharacterized protein LOC127281800 n=1 Tax=Leptopilina boulardi TaxID=63433 RepID=UPI0021F5EE04|nr:uncharacterized protein LOC127281800 [Leptopilina boulardi]
MSLSEEFWYLILGTIGMIGIIRLTAFYMRFERSTWQILNIFQIIIGMSTAREPKKFVERIVFGSLLITCVVYSGYFYSVILDITWPVISEINTLEELANSSLTPMGMREDLGPLYTLCRNNLIIEKLCLKIDYLYTIPVYYNDYCMTYLTEHKNISCLLSNAENVVNEYNSKNEANIKILDEIVFQDFITYTNLLNVHKDLPKKLIRSAFEFGLLKELLPYKVRETKILPPEVIEKEKLFFVLFRVLAIGYSLSLISFLIEVFTAIFERRMYTLYTRFRFAN